MSTSGNRIAISGNESDEPDMFRGVVNIYDLETGVSKLITTASSEAAAPVVNVVLSGDGDTLAVSALFPPDGSGISSVTVYNVSNLSSGSSDKIGAPIKAGSMGDLPGLRLDMSEDGTTLIVGARNYDDGRGRARLYIISKSSNQIKLLDDVAFEGATGSKDHEGTSVSLSGDGNYMAIGGTGIANGDDGPLTGAVKVYHVASKQLIGDIIYGKSAQDATGFSIDLVAIGEILYVAVASIFFDSDDGVSNRGKVDIYSCSKSDCSAWTKLGDSLVGDKGATLDFSEGNYHIGDSFGFALGLAKMSSDNGGLRVAVGSPFFSNVRESDAYYGVVKLFEYTNTSDTLGSWKQLAYDLVGNSRNSLFGTSIALVKGGDILAIGGGPEVLDGSNGEVVVYAQDETSVQPSSLPSVMPSKGPSSLPSTVPSPRPSLMPSKKPSGAPSITPSRLPSKIPSPHPSSTPSAKPSISLEPSIEPSKFVRRGFMILSKYKEFADLPMGDRPNKNWCLERIISAGGFSSLKMRPCEIGHDKQIFYYDSEAKVIQDREENPNFCIVRNGQQLMPASCGRRNTNVETNISERALNLGLDETSTGSISMKTSKNEFYFVIDSITVFSRVKLLKKGTQNSSHDKWQLQYTAASEFPSYVSPTCFVCGKTNG